jgi:hypothetical protein
MSRSEMPQSPLDPIARDSIPNRTTNDKANAGPVIQVPLIQTHSMDDQRWPAHAYATPGRLPEILCAAHSQ